MHFVIKFKISWILKWNYVKEGDIIDRHWFAKWWDKFPQTDAIIKIVYKDFARKTTPKNDTPLAIPAAKPQAITTGIVTPSQFLPPTEKKDDDEKSIVASSSSSNKKKKGPSKNDMRMFAQFLKTFKEENNIEDSGKEDDFEFFHSRPLVFANMIATCSGMTRSVLKMLWMQSRALKTSQS
jgi:hypothetical protein